MEKLSVRDELLGPDFKYNETEHLKYTESWAENISREPSHLYFDLCLFKDIKLAALFEVSKNIDNSVPYIYSNIYDYDCRVQDDNIFEYFPSLLPLKENYDKLLSNENHHPYLWMMAPFTFLVPIMSHIFNIGKKSAAMHVRSYSPNVFLNTYPYKTNAVFLKLLKKQFSYIYPKLNLIILYKPYKDLSYDLLKSADMFFINDSITALKEDTPLFKSIFVDQLFKEKAVTVTRRLDFSLDHVKEEETDYDAIFASTELCLKLVCEFSYFIPYILIEEDYTSPSEIHKENLIQLRQKIT
jgi:hypothetical protein